MTLETKRQIIIQVTIENDEIHYQMRGFAKPAEAIYALERIKNDILSGRANPKPRIPGMLDSDLKRVGQ